ncbi:MAG TPA: hypothetical protein VLQ80_34545, partial [Candidatus Saccharimonadia bacterium]|nr:hypothetical protein [Candidatus Saccharimonadia bacterium]
MIGMGQAPLCQAIVVIAAGSCPEGKGAKREGGRNSRRRYQPFSAAVKNFVPSKKRFGRLKMEMNVAP